MTHPPPGSLRSVASAARAPATPAQQRFGQLIDRIEAARQKLADWNAALQALRQGQARDIDPLLAEWRQQTAWLAVLLEQQGLRAGLSRELAQALRGILCRLVEPLLDTDAGGDMQALFNRQSEIDHVPPRTAAAQQPSSGPAVELDEAARAAASRDAAKAQARGQRQTAQARREALEAAAATRSLREVFRKLASALHPDREPDAAERSRKTSLMQRVNQAHQAGDLLALLALQLEVEQIDLQQLHQLAEDRLRHYNRVLAGQLAELQQALHDIEAGVRLEFGLDSRQRLAPSLLKRLLLQDKQALQAAVAQRKSDRRELADLRQLKAWVKRQQARGLD